jgi:hypothetical protein
MSPAGLLSIDANLPTFLDVAKVRRIENLGLGPPVGLPEPNFTTREWRGGARG